MKIVGTELTAFIKRSELARDRNDQRAERFQVGQKVDARVIQFDRRAHKVQLSIKALEVAEEKEAIAQYGSSDSGATLGDILGAGAPMESAPGELKKGSVVTTEVTEVKEGGLEVKILDTDLTSFIKRSELARDRNDQRSDRFAVGQKVDARVILFDRRASKVQLSIKALEIADEKEAIAQYGSSDSGATLGDILGSALKRKGEEADGDDAKE